MLLLVLNSHFPIYYVFFYSCTHSLTNPILIYHTYVVRIVIHKSLFRPLCSWFIHYSVSPPTIHLCNSFPLSSDSPPFIVIHLFFYVFSLRPAMHLIHRSSSTSYLHPPTRRPLSVFPEVFFVDVLDPLVAADHVVLDEELKGVAVEVLVLQPLLLLPPCHQHLMASNIGRERKLLGEHLQERLNLCRDGRNELWLGCGTCDVLLYFIPLTVHHKTSLGYRNEAKSGWYSSLVINVMSCICPPFSPRV